MREQAASDSPVAWYNKSPLIPGARCASDACGPVVGIVGAIVPKRFMEGLFAVLMLCGRRHDHTPWPKIPSDRLNGIPTSGITPYIQTPMFLPCS